MPEPEFQTDAPDRYCRVVDGFLYASCRLRNVATVRPSAVLLLSLGPRPFLLSVQGQTLPLNAAAIRPFVMRGLDTQGQALLSLNVHPTHAAYLSFGGIGGTGVQTLPRSAFARLDTAMHGLFSEGVLLQQGQALADALLARLAPLLPSCAPADPWRLALLAWLRQHPEASLAELAQGLGMSYHHMSHRFSQAMGLSFRQWRAFARTLRAVRRFKQATTLTGIAHEAGYTDSAHLSRTWQRAYGLSPSFVRHSNWVQATY